MEPFKKLKNNLLTNKKEVDGSLSDDKQKLSKMASN